MFKKIKLSAYVLNQSNNHWLLSDALLNVNACAQKVKGREEVTNSPALGNLINDDFGIAFELSLCYQYQEEGLWCSRIIPFFFLQHEEKKSYNMLCLMLDPRFKSLHLVFSFICHEEGVSIVEEYNR